MLQMVHGVDVLMPANSSIILVRRNRPLAEKEESGLSKVHMYNDYVLYIALTHLTLHPHTTHTITFHPPTHNPHHHNLTHPHTTHTITFHLPTHSPRQSHSSRVRDKLPGRWKHQVLHKALTPPSRTLSSTHFPSYCLDGLVLV